MNETCPERAVIASVIIDNSTISIVGFLNDADFNGTNLAEIWRVIVKLLSDDKPADLLTVSEQLKENNSEVGIVFLTELFDYLPSSAHAEYYAKIVKERSIRRRIISESLNTTELLSEGKDTHEVVLAYNTAVAAILSELSSEGCLTTKELSIVGKRALENAYNGNTDCISTGFYDLDSLLCGGFHKKTLNYLAGRPSMGKTALALCLAMNMSTKFTGAIFSLETGSVQLIHRAWAAKSKVNFKHLTDEKGLTEHDFPKLYKAMEKVNQARLFWFDNFSITIAQIKANCLKLKKKHGLDFIIIDYLQLINSSGKSENQNVKISEFSRQLKGLSGDLDIAVICLSQLNRALEKREDKRPMLSDLRDSGSIEQDADTVTFIYRGDVYRNKEKDNDYRQDDDNIAEIIVAKNKEGATGMVKLLFLKEYTLFENFNKKEF